MDSVTAFNSELSGLYDSKPPISKAKMASITRSAMKAIKFYKHVVQSVEKFILKCKPEYKIPGLYVIDSIVRQSRHQFGPEKDVFAPRFARNIKQTFANLFRCTPEDKSRIIRVLNLWQKNNVFAPEVIQPLFDLADPNNPIYQSMPPVNSSLDISTCSNGLNTSGEGSALDKDEAQLKSLDLTAAGSNLTQLLKDPNVLRQLQTLQKLKQQEEKQNKLNEMRLQEEAFEKHLQHVLKGSNVQSTDVDKEVQFVSSDDVEVINLDGNDSRSPTPDRDRYSKRRRSSRSRSPRDSRGRDRRRRSSRSRSRSVRSRSRGGSRSPRSNRRRSSRDRDRGKERDKEKEKEKEYERERRRKGLPDIKKEHLSVCSTTLWVGHLSKLVQQEELSDTFGKYGDIVSIDMIHPRGCAFIVMNRRQDAHKAMGALKNFKMQGRAITISWAAGKGVKSKEWKDFWDLDLGVTYIPWNKLTPDVDFTAIEEGGMFDEDTLPEWIKEKLKQKIDLKDKGLIGLYGVEGMPTVDTSQPPPTAMIPGVPLVPSFPMGPRLMPPMGVPLPSNLVPGMVPGIPLPHMPPPHILPPGGIVPAFGAIPPPMDKSVPPPNTSDNATMQFMGNMGIPTFSTMGIPPQFNQQQSTQLSTGNNDDHMDIEMEDEPPINAPKPPASMNFNQPPPLFQSSNFNMGVNSNDRKNDHDNSSGRDNIRDRNDFSIQRERSSRWGNERSISRERDMPSRDRGDNNSRSEFNRVGGRHDQMNECPPQIWRDIGHSQNFQPPNFGDRRGQGSNIMAMDMPNRPHEFFDGRRDDFNMDDRRGGQQRDFSQNPGNRFGSQHMGSGMGRGTQMSMRGGPSQSAFGQRPMFIRGPGRTGPPGFNYGNDRSFDWEDRGGGNNNRMRGNNNGRHANRREDDEGRRGNRFHNRDSGDRSEGKVRDRYDRGDHERNFRNDRRASPPPPGDQENVEDDWDNESSDRSGKNRNKKNDIINPFSSVKNRNDEDDWDNDLDVPNMPSDSKMTSSLDRSEEKGADSLCTPQIDDREITKNETNEVANEQYENELKSEPPVSIVSVSDCEKTTDNPGGKESKESDEVE